MRPPTTADSRRNGRYSPCLLRRFIGVSVAVMLLGSTLLGIRMSAAAAENAAVAQRLVPDHLFGVDFATESVGYASGYYGTVLKTIDGGSHWLRLDTGGNELLRRIEAVDALHVWAVGHRGSVLHSSDGGSRWVSQYQLPGSNLRDVAFTNTRSGWVVGHEALISATTDGGQTWHRQALKGYEGRDQPRLNAVLAIDEQRVVVAGEFGVIAVSQDAGQNWTLLDTPARTTLTALASRNGLVTAVGLDGVIWQFAIDDPGALKVVNSGTHEHLFDVATDVDGAVVVGNTVLLDVVGQHVRRLSTDSGIDLPFGWYHGVAVLPSSTGVLAVGIRGEIIKARGTDRRFAPLARISDPTTVSASAATTSRAG